MISFDSEKSLEDFIYNHWRETGRFIADGKEYQVCLRQVNLGGYGIADLIFVSLDLSDIENTLFVFHVVELKNEKIKLKDFGQISRYLTGVNKATASSHNYKRFRSYGSLVVKDGIINDNDAAYIPNILGTVHVYEFKIDPVSCSIVFEEFTGAYRPKEDVDEVLENLTYDALNLIEKVKQQ